MDGFSALASLVRGAWSAVTSSHADTLVVYVLGLTFIVAATAKLRRPDLAALAIVDFGVTKRPSRALAIALGIVELGLGVFLLLGVARIMTLTVAACLLWLFAALMIRSLSAGQSFACYCFGGASAVSAASVARTTLLALAALVPLGSPLPASGTFDLGALVVGVAFIGSLALISALLHLRSTLRDKEVLTPSSAITT